MKSIADLRSEKYADRPERPYTAIVGEGQKYLVELQRLTAAHDALATDQGAAERALESAVARAAATPRPQGAKGDSGVDAIKVRIAEVEKQRSSLRGRMGELMDLLAEYEGEVTVRATRSDGDWERWRIANPPRGEDEPGHRDDWLVASGFCNADALLDDLATYVVAWAGEELGPGDYEALNLVRPDKKAIARIVISLYESGDDLGEFRRGLSALLKSENFSVSRAPSASPSDDSSAGSPPKDTSTSTTTKVE